MLSVGLPTSNMSYENKKTGCFISEAQAEIEDDPPKTHYWYCKPGLVNTDKLNFVRAKFPTGAFHDFHNHPAMEEILYVLSGTAEQWIETEKRILKAGDSVHIPKTLVHATFNAGEDTLEFLAILTPADSDGPMTVDRSQEEPWKSIRSAPSSG